jgi:hypothetical protein
MSGPLERLLRGPALEANLYPPESRYNGVPLATFTLSDGRTVRYLRRRLLPDASMLATIGEYRVVDGDRLDNLAASLLGDPLAAWRMADANVVLRMESLVEETGRRIRITLPEGVPAAPPIT